MWIVCFPVSLACTTVKVLYQCAGFKHFTNIGLGGGEGGKVREGRGESFSEHGKHGSHGVVHPDLICWRKRLFQMDVLSQAAAMYVLRVLS